MTPKEVKPGMKFGSLTVIKIYKGKLVNDKYNRLYAVCKCDCGNPNLKYVRCESLTSCITKTCGKCGIYKYIGKRFGRWTVIGGYIYSKQGRFKLKCKCDCGTEKYVDLSGLLSGTSASCGCSYIENINNFINKKFNRWTVLEFSHRNKASTPYYKCKCECGNIKLVDRYSLVSGDNRSCGECYKGLKDSYMEPYKTNYRYLIKVYTNILTRCERADSSQFYNYGGRGIKLSMSRFEFIKKFYKTDNVLNLEVDRINNDGDYSIDNVRFVTRKENSSNRFISHAVSYDRVASRLMPMLTFKSVKLEIKTPLDNKNFMIVKFPLKTTKNEDLYLFIHKSINDYMFYINRIRGFYKEFGKEIPLTEIVITQAYENLFMSKLEEFRDLNVNTDISTFKRFYSVFMNIKMYNAEFDNLDPVMLYEKI